MIYRLLAAAILTVTLGTTAYSAIPTKDDAFAGAVERLKLKEYQGARSSAAKSNMDPGMKALLIGYCDVKLESWDDAAREMATAAQSYPLLADYGLYYQGMALAKLKKNDEALIPLYKLLKSYPDSRLVRSAWLLYADTLLAGGYYKEALTSYQSFIERYPAGNDSIQAVYGSGLSREKMGDATEAAKVFRGIWLNYPASTFAEKASEELKKLAASGTPMPPYKNAELVKRAGTLFDLGRYKRAAQAYAEIPLQGEPEDTACRIKLKRGQSLLRARRYVEAEEVLKGVAKAGLPACATEASFLVARTMDSTGRSDEAYTLYLQLAETARVGTVADDAVLRAAYLKRFQRKWKEALPLFKRYLAGHPTPGKIPTVMWEAAWAAYQSRSYSEAAQLFRRMTEREETREKALYWLGKTLIASGDRKGGEAMMAQMCSEYPFGYYAYLCNKGSLAGTVDRPPVNLRDAIPVPAGFERVKALIALGIYEEAARELSARKSKNTMAVARLYLEMENYNSAYHTVTRDGRKRIDKESPTIVGIRYPLAFHEYVAKNAAANGLPESLVYGIIFAESTYSPSALSPVGAVGLMQIMPATAERISQGDSLRLTRPELNIRLGTKHLKNLLKNSDGNLMYAVAAYNAGSGNLKRWQKRIGDLPLDEFVETIPFGETREYVKKVVATMALYQKLYQLPDGAPQQPRAPERAPGKPATEPVSERSPGKPATAPTSVPSPPRSPL